MGLFKIQPNFFSSLLPLIPAHVHTTGKQCLLLGNSLSLENMIKQLLSDKRIFKCIKCANLNSKEFAYNMKTLCYSQRSLANMKMLNLIKTCTIPTTHNSQWKCIG